MYLCVGDREGRVSLWLIMMMVVVLWLSWVAMRAQWIDVIVVLKYGRRARPLPFHFDECARLADPKIMSLFYGKLYRVSVVRHARGKE